MTRTITGVFILGFIILTLGACVRQAPVAEHQVDKALMAEWIDSYMLRWDEDRDGLLSKAEFHGRPVAFVQADEDEDNVLHYGELMTMLGGDKPIQYSPKRFAALRDFDGDGAVSRSEWMQAEPGDALFKEIDGDADDSLALLEIESFLYRYERRIENLPDIEEADLAPVAEAAAPLPMIAAATQPAATAPAEKPETLLIERVPYNIVANPSVEKDIEGWVAHHSIVDRVSGPGQASDGLYALKCATKGQLYDGILYGCVKANVCDDKTAPVSPATDYDVSVMVKGVANYKGVSLQLQVIGGGASFGTVKAQLDGSWQKMTLKIKSKADTKFLGVQIVKAKDAAKASFFVDDLRITTTAE